VTLIAAITQHVLRVLLADEFDHLRVADGHSLKLSLLIDHN
jgi:hypothetical protein